MAPAHSNARSPPDLWSGTGRHPDLLPQFQVMRRFLMNAGAPYQAMRDAVHIHPTLGKAVQSAVSALD
jgi:hypothetical protein